MIYYQYLKTMISFLDVSMGWTDDSVSVIGRPQYASGGKQSRFNTGWGQHSTPGHQGYGTVQVNMMIRLCFGKGVKPSSRYDLDARELSNIGRLFIQIAALTANNVSIKIVFYISAKET